MGEEPLFLDLLRRLHLDLSGLSNGLRRVLSSAIVGGRAFEVTIPDSSASVTASHAIGRVLTGACLTPTTPVALGATWDASTITVTRAAPYTGDVLVRVWCY